MSNIKIELELAKSSKISKYLKLIDKNRYYSNFGPLYEYTRKRLINDYRLKNNSIILTSSGHSAVQACCYFLKQKTKKKYIITTSFNFFSAPQAIIQSGFKPYFVDIELSSFSINFNNLERAIKINKKNLAGIIIPSPFGYPVNIKKLNLIQKKYKIDVIYDAADTFINFDKYLDMSNIMICCSFHPTKSFPANESGLIICPKKKVNYLKSIISFGFTGKNREANLLGFNGKFSEYDAAIFNANYDLKESIKKKIKSSSIYFLNKFKKLDNNKIFIQKDFGIKWYSTKISFYCKNHNFSQLQKKFEKLGIKIYTAWNKKPMHMHSLFKKYKRDNLTFTKKLNNHFFTVPLNINIKKSQINKIINFFKKCL